MAHAAFTVALREVPGRPRKASSSTGQSPDSVDWRGRGWAGQLSRGSRTIPWPLHSHPIDAHVLLFSCAHFNLPLHPLPLTSLLHFNCGLLALATHIHLLSLATSRSAPHSTRDMSSSLLDVSASSPVVVKPHPRLHNALFGVMVLLSVVLSLLSFRYLLGVGFLPPAILGNLFARPFLYVHIAAAITALLLGPIQFIPSLRRRYLTAHRLTGRVYVLSCLVGGLTGLVLSFGTTAGPVVGTGFFALGVCWLVTTARAWAVAVKGLIPQHKAWMTRSFALTFAAVTARVLIFGLPPMGIAFNTTYGIAAWLGWIPNLLVVEWYLRRQHSAEAKSVDLTGETPGVSHAVIQHVSAEDMQRAVKVTSQQYVPLVEEKSGQVLDDGSVQ